jgi:hypothetical protein
MAVVTTTFSSAAGDVWASPTWVSTDPSWKLDVQLTNWVNAINDASKISIIHDPGDATARGSTDIVRWLLRCRESDTSSDYGFHFCGSPAGGNNTSDCGRYYNRTVSSAHNNGSGLYSRDNIGSGGVLPAGLSSYAVDYRTAYDAEGATPWFALLTRTVVNGQNTGGINFLCRLSTANMAAGSYYPTPGLGKWIYASANGYYFYQAPSVNFLTPQRNIVAPYIGTNSSRELRFPRPLLTIGDGYFFKLGAQYGDTHFLGEPTYDMLVSNGSTGDWGDTVILEGKTYTRAPGALWVRIA